jgi:hypothetical protein
MKKVFFLLMAACGLQLASFSQSDRYAGAMKANLTLLDSAKTSEDFVGVANSFERIANSEKTQWLPYYYAGLALSSAGWQPDTKDKDANSTKINSLMDQAEALTTNDSDKSEIVGVRYMAYTQQMQVDPQTRWMTYGKQAGDALDKGMKLNADNPRMYYLKGMNLFYTPAQFGGGKDKAKLAFEKAVTLYGQAKPQPLYPDWGQKQSMDMIMQCQ